MSNVQMVPSTTGTTAPTSQADTAREFLAFSPTLPHVEVDVIQRIAEAFSALDSQAQLRVAAWVAGRFGGGT